ncbi:hypothetical protein MICAF_3590004 [Microcystis aeruginosa PCC 9807]|uniref:Uncharacterized protein n=1 Tax=Microcystis aeruginosa PCC 9807 TaxID=1160283 RepID=I4H7W4_MICAE|nr:hypothetical protein MICAF_3590004 [Microcystis aeruginosa PCC 9807]
MRLVFQIYVQALFSFYDGEVNGIPTVMIGQNKRKAVLRYLVWFDRGA